MGPPVSEHLATLISQTDAAAEPGSGDKAKAADIVKASFFMAAKEVAAMLRQGGMTEDELLHSLIVPASKLARPYISRYFVGAVGLGESGSVYFGVNIEFPDVPLNQSIHAEQCLIANALLHGERGLRKLAVSAAPCGHCRQFYSELCCADTIQISFGDPIRSYQLADVLPQRFGPGDLLHGADVPLLLQPQRHEVSLISPPEQAANGARSPPQAAVDAALKAAQQCYCPYTHCPSGVAIMTADGGAFAGGYVESAAYNPGLPPFQAAIVAAVVGGMPSYDQIAHVVLVEGSGNGFPVQQAATVRLVLDAVAPRAQLTVLRIGRGQERASA